MPEKPTPNEYDLAGVRDAEGKLDTSRAARLYIEPNEAKAAEAARNTSTVNNLREVFGTMATSPKDQHISLMLQEQGPLITKYLKDTTKGGEGGDVYNDMAPGVAMLGFELSSSGFGREEIDTGDKKHDEEMGKTADKRYKAAKEVFDQLIVKMYPEGSPKGEALLTMLEGPLSEAHGGDVRAFIDTFRDLKEGLTELYKDGLPNDDKGILEYQRLVDSLIQRVGDTLGEAAATNAKLGVDGKITLEQSQASRTDMLNMAVALKELQNLRRDSVRYKYQSGAYDNFAPRDLKKIEGLERKAKTL